MYNGKNVFFYANKFHLFADIFNLYYKLPKQGFYSKSNKVCNSLYIDFFKFIKISSCLTML